MGALVGHPLYLAFGKTGAAITAILLIFVFLMIITGTTLMSLFRTMARPVKSISEQAENAYQARLERESEEAQSGKQLKVIKGFNVDIPVDDIPEKRNIPKTSLDEKQRKVVSAYYGETAESEPESPAATEPEEKTDDIKPEIETALKAAKNEAEAEKRDIPTEKPAEPTKPAEFSVPEKETEPKTEGYSYPPLSLLNKSKATDTAALSAEFDHTAGHLVNAKSFGVETRIVDISRGPTVTRYELQPCAGVKISKITNLADDIALNLATAGVRIEAPIPNKAAVGIEVPNKASAVVGVRGILESRVYKRKSKLTVALGAI
ncbi:MAG: DNA translocase FtsK [Oscillospiraceae bacterium]